MPSSRNTFAPLFFALLVLLLAAAMRIIGAGHMPYWSDEAWNLWATDSGIGIMLDRLAANHHPPAFFLALDAWQNIAGDSRIAARFISIAAGMLATAVIYRAGKDSFGTAVGICAALIFAVFEQPVYYGQSVRHYAWLLLAEALAIWLFLRALRRPTWRRFAAYGASVMLIAYTVYIGLIAVAVQAVIGLFVWRAPLRFKVRLLAAYIGALVLFAPWLAFALQGVLRKIDVGIITGYHNSITTTPDGVLKMLDILFGGQAALGLALIALALGVLFAAIRRYAGSRDAGGLPLPALTVLACSVGGLIIMAALNLRVGIVSERTLAFMTPLFALAMGIGAASLQPRPRQLMVGALVVWAVLTPQHVIPRLNSDLAAQTVAAGYSAGDLVVLETGFDDMAFAYEMETALPRDNRRVFPTFYEYFYPDDPAMLAALEEQIAVSDRVWLVYWNVPPRMDERLRAAGFTRTGRDRVPVGSDDPLYVIDPEIEISRYVRARADRSTHDFGEAIRLLDVLAPQHTPSGTPFSVDLVWLPLETLDRDYTVALFLQDAGGVTRLESFGPDERKPTTRWPLDAPTIDTHRMIIPPDLPAGRYTIYAVVYWYQAVDQPLHVNGAGGAVIATIDIE